MGKFLKEGAHLYLNRALTLKLMPLYMNGNCIEIASVNEYNYENFPHTMSTMMLHSLVILSACAPLLPFLTL